MDEQWVRKICREEILRREKELEAAAEKADTDEQAFHDSIMADIMGPHGQG